MINQLIESARNELRWGINPDNIDRRLKELRAIILKEVMAKDAKLVGFHVRTTGRDVFTICKNKKGKYAVITFALYADWIVRPHKPYASADKVFKLLYFTAS